MGLKVYKPINSSSRGLVNIDRSSLWKGRPEKSLCASLNRTGGRNSYGRVTCRHRGGGGRRLYRMINFNRKPQDLQGEARRIEYDPCRSAFIALVEYPGGAKQYIIAPDKLKPGDAVGGSEVRVGACMKLAEVPSGVKVHNIELRPGSKAKMVRAAGTFAQVLGLEGNTVSVRLPSGEVKKLPKSCVATIGVVSNSSHMHRNHAKAGRMRWMGRRPIVRGTAMNAVSHKHGGGRGKSKGCHPVSPTGVLAKGYRTRRKKIAKK